MHFNAKLTSEQNVAVFFYQTAVNYVCLQIFVMVQAPSDVLFSHLVLLKEQHHPSKLSFPDLAAVMSQLYSSTL